MLRLVTNPPKLPRKSPAIKPERVWRVGGEIYATRAEALKAAADLRETKTIDLLEATIARHCDLPFTTIVDVADAIMTDFTVKPKARKP